MFSFYTYVINTYFIQLCFQFSSSCFLKIQKFTEHIGKQKYLGSQFIRVNILTKSCNFIFQILIQSTPPLHGDCHFSSSDLYYFTSRRMKQPLNRYPWFQFFPFCNVSAPQYSSEVLVWPVVVLKKNDLCSSKLENAIGHILPSYRVIKSVSTLKIFRSPE